MPEPSEVVDALLQAWSRLDADEIASFYAEDAVWEDPVPSEPVRGRQAIRDRIARFIPHVSDVRMETLHQAATGPIVMHERIDHVTYRGRRLALWAMSIYEIEDGLIRANREYWDPAWRARALTPPKP